MGTRQDLRDVKGPTWPGATVLPLIRIWEMQWASLSLGAQEPQHRHGGEQVEPGGEATGVFAASKASHQ